MREKTKVAVQPDIRQTTQPTQLQESRWKRWMRYFYSDDVSPDNYPLVDLQRRTGWFCLAFIAQALNEIDRSVYVGYIPLLKTWSALIPFVLILVSFFGMWMAFRPTSLKRKVERSQKKGPSRLQRVILVCALLTAIAGSIEFGRSVVMSFFLQPQYTNDGTSLDTNAAVLLLEGRNPYTDSNILSVVRRYPILPNWTTPLRVGQFANERAYPSSSEMRSVLDTDLKAGSAPEFESKVSYPALAFLTLMPFAWLNFQNVLSFYLFSYLLLVYIGWKVARPELRPWVLLLSLTNVSMWTSVVGGNLDIFYTLLIVLAWLVRDSRSWSAIFLGLALASKQIAWFYIPFYAILIMRQYSFKEAVQRLSVAGLVALAINLPFILWNPHAWMAGVLAPVADPMFPMGVGLISLSATPLQLTLPSFVYTGLELLTLLACLAWYWRICQKRPEAVMLLAVLPLFFAWRSLPSYFYCSAFPMFILMSSSLNVKPRQQSHKMLSRLGRLLFGPNGEAEGELSPGMGAWAMSRVPQLLPAPAQSSRRFDMKGNPSRRARDYLPEFRSFASSPLLE